MLFNSHRICLKTFFYAAILFFFTPSCTLSALRRVYFFRCDLNAPTLERLWGGSERTIRLRVFPCSREEGVGGVFDSCLPTPSRYEVDLGRKE